MGLLAVAPAGHIGQQLGQRRALLLLPQGPVPLRGAEPLRRRQLRGFQRQASQQDWNAIKNCRQTEVWIAGGVANPADRRKKGSGNRYQAGGGEQCLHGAILPHVGTPLPTADPEPTNQDDRHP